MSKNSDNTYVILTINGVDTCAGRSLSFYLADKHCDKINNFSFEGLWNDSTFKKIKSSRFLCNNDITINYKTADINIEYQSHGSEPGELRFGNWGYYTTIKLSTLKSNNGLQLLENFMDFLKDYYDDNILYQKGKKNEVIIQSWNTYSWETSNTKIKRDIKTVYLPNDIKDDIVKRIDIFLDINTKTKYENCGIPYKLNLLLGGYPGTGKTSLIFALASKYDYNISIMSFTNKVDDLSFIKALQKIPNKTFLILEDIDCLFKERKGDDYRNSVTFTAIINGLDGLYSKNGLITFMSTNYIENLDVALIRPGRVDYQYKFDYMEKYCMESMFNVFFPELESEFHKFYKKIQNKKVLSSAIQQYLFKYNDIDSILKNTDELDSFSINKCSLYM